MSLFFVFSFCAALQKVQFSPRTQRQLETELRLANFVSVMKPHD